MVHQWIGASQGFRTRLLPLLLLLLTGPSTVGSLVAAEDVAMCPTTNSLLLMQTPVGSLEAEGYEDNLDVVDACGRTLGVIDVPSPSLVMPTARSGVALVQTSGGSGKNDPGDTYLVDARAETAVKLDVPLMSPMAVWIGAGSVWRTSSGSHALIVSRPADDALESLHVVDLETATTRDVLAAISDARKFVGGVEAMWIDTAAGSLVLLGTEDRLVAPIGDLALFERQERGFVLDMPLPGQNLCYHVVGTYDGPALKACASATEPDQWRVRQKKGGSLIPLPQFTEWDFQLITSVNSTGWVAWPHALTSGGIHGLNGMDTPVRWVVFAKGVPNRYGIPRAVSNLAGVVVLDVTDLSSVPIGGLPPGPASIEFLGPASSGDAELIHVTPLDSEGAVDVESVELDGELYLVDLETATASYLGSDVGGAISPDGAAVATTALLHPATVGQLAVGPVGDPMVEVGPGFGTWLTP